MSELTYTTPVALLNAICSAVREKDGTTENIAYQDLPQRVLDIPSEESLPLTNLIPKYQIKTKYVGGTNASVTLINCETEESQDIVYTIVDTGQGKTPFTNDILSLWYHGSSGGWHLTSNDDYDIYITIPNMPYVQTTNKSEVWLYNSSVDFTVCDYSEVQYVNTELMNDICDAIHEKDGTSDEILYEDIPQRILDIPSGETKIWVPSLTSYNKSYTTSLHLNTKYAIIVSYLAGGSNTYGREENGFDIENKTQLTLPKYGYDQFIDSYFYIATPTSDTQSFIETVSSGSTSTDYSTINCINISEIDINNYTSYVGETTIDTEENKYYICLIAYDLYYNQFNDIIETDAILLSQFNINEDYGYSYHRGGTTIAIIKAVSNTTNISIAGGRQSMMVLEIGDFSPSDHGNE